MEKLEAITDTQLLIGNHSEIFAKKKIFFVSISGLSNG